MSKRFSEYQSNINNCAGNSTSTYLHGTNNLVGSVGQQRPCLFVVQIRKNGIQKVIAIT